MNNKLKLFYFLIYIIFFNQIIYLLNSWSFNTYYQHSFFIILLGIYFLKNDQKISLSLKSKVCFKSFFFLIALSCFFYFLGIKLSFNYLKIISLYLVILSHLLLHINKLTKSLRIFLFSILLLIPVPYIYDLTVFLQNFSTKIAVMLISPFFKDISLSANTVVMPSGNFVIGAASSGIRSFLFFPTLFLIFTLKYKTHFIKNMSGLIITGIISQIINVLRITSMFILAYFTTNTFSYDLFHPYLNIVFFIIMFILTIFVLKSSKLEKI